MTNTLFLLLNLRLQLIDQSLVLGLDDLYCAGLILLELVGLAFGYYLADLGLDGLLWLLGGEPVLGFFLRLRVDVLLFEQVGLLLLLLLLGLGLCGLFLLLVWLAL